MRRQRIAFLSLAFALFALLPAALEAQADALRGKYTLNAGASDDVNAAIERAVREMNFVTRPIARGRLRETNVPYKRVELAFDANRVWVTTDERAPVVSALNGAVTKWRRDDGKLYDVTTTWRGSRLVQTFTADDGQRINEFSVSPDGRTLTMDVTIKSPRLKEDVKYKLVFNRAS